MPDVALPTLTIAPISPAIGARVTGIDLTRPLPDGAFAALERALVTHHVLFFENQPLTPHQQRDFAARFGDLHIHPVYPNVPERPEIMDYVKRISARPAFAKVREMDAKFAAEHEAAVAASNG